MKLNIERNAFCEFTSSMERLAQIWGIMVEGNRMASKHDQWRIPVPSVLKSPLSGWEHRYVNFLMELGVLIISGSM